MLIHKSVSEKVSAEIHRVDDHYVLEIVKNLNGSTEVAGGSVHNLWRK